MERSLEILMGFPEAEKLSNGQGAWWLLDLGNGGEKRGLSLEFLLPSLCMSYRTNKPGVRREYTFLGLTHFPKRPEQRRKRKSGLVRKERKRRI